METIKCKNPKTYNLTKGKEYTTFPTSETDLYVIINDRGIKGRYGKSLFEPVTPPPFTNQQIIESISLISTENEDDEQDVIIRFKTSVDDIIDIVVDEILSVEEASNSCGIKQISGINPLIDKINEVCENVDLAGPALVELKQLLFARAIKEYVRLITKPFSAFSTFSTNVTDEKEMFIDVLNDYSDCTSQALNPNSNNQIIVWVIKNSNFDL